MSHITRDVEVSYGGTAGLMGRVDELMTDQHHLIGTRTQFETIESFARLLDSGSCQECV